MTVHGISLELESGARTTLAGVPAAAVCRHGGRVLGSDGVSLFVIGGDSDDGAPIALRCTLAPVAVGGLSRLLGLALEGVVAGRVEVAARSETGCELDGAAGPGSESGLPGRTMARLGRGGGHSWDISLAGDDGAALDITALELRVMPLDRRS
ncbi:hypothetical protein [Solidesulfovibrio sp.]